MPHDEIVAKIFARTKHAGVKSNKGASERALAGREAKFGFALPPPMRALYAQANGFGARFSVEHPQAASYALLTLAQIESEWTELRASRDAGWKTHWLPLATDRVGNVLVVDASARGGGRVGRFPGVKKDLDVVAKSTTDLLMRVHWIGVATSAHRAPARGAFKGWLLTLNELPGFCRKHAKVIAKLPRDLLDVACMVTYVGDSIADANTYEVSSQAIYARIPERGHLASADVDAVFSLLEKLEKLLHKHCPDYAYEGLANTNDVSAEFFFHDSAPKKAVAAELKKMKIAVDDTPRVISLDDQLRWLTT